MTSIAGALTGTIGGWGGVFGVKFKKEGVFVVD
jgi:hypothetical protein